MYECTTGRPPSPFRDGLRLVLEQETDELLTLVSQVSDMMNAVHYLPKGVLWSQTFPQWKVGLFGFIASFAGWLRLYRVAQRSAKLRAS